MLGALCTIYYCNIVDLLTSKKDLVASFNHFNSSIVSYTVV